MRNEPEWIKWGGLTDECPVPNGHDVEVKFMNGEIRKADVLGNRDWLKIPDNAKEYEIIAYRDWTVFREQQDMINQCWTTTMKQQEKSEVVNEPEWEDWWDADHEGRCPVPSGHDVEVRFLNGDTVRDCDPEGWNWNNSPHIETDADIVAYRDWTVFNQQQEEKQMTGQQFKQQRNHPASALAEQIDQAGNQSNQKYESVINLLDALSRDQQLFALGYLTAKLNK